MGELSQNFTQQHEHNSSRIQVVIVQQKAIYRLTRYGTSSSAMAEDRAKVDTFAINVQRSSQTHAQNSFLGHPMRTSWAI